jgi:two-component system, chemotaxis family, response regulator Rcp1
MQARPVEILLVEDNPGDVALVQEALRSVKVLNHISVATDGKAAMAFLNRLGGSENAPRPDLILLDLNIPRKHGFEVLRAIRRDPAVSFVPVVVLTTSQDQRDIKKSYDLGANCFVSKPIDVDKFLSVVSFTGEFWISLVEKPCRRSPASG